MSLPWPIALAIGIVIWAAAPYAAGVGANASPLFVKSHQAVIDVLRILSYVCFAAAAGSLLRGRLIARKFDQQRSLEDLRGLSWQQFEVMVGEAFRRTGYAVVETGQGGADGGVDLVLTKAGQRFLVQCKQYRSSQVGVTIVREIYGVAAARQAAGAIVVTTGRFTKDAVEFAQSLPIELIDGAKLEAMVRGINGLMPGSTTAKRAREVPAPSAAAQVLSCPVCSSTMVLRTARGNGSQFYGCSTFPRCRGTRQV